MKVPVLIAGAGPVGLTMAIELTRYGVPVRIIDKTSSRTDKSKALVVWPRTLELLEPSGSSREMLKAGLKTHGASLYDDTRLIGQIRLEGVNTAYPYGLMIPQSETERVLETKLEILGIKVERETELIESVDQGTIVHAKVRLKSGEIEEIESDWLLGCDGAHSFVRHALGMKFEGDTVQINFILADVKLDSSSFVSKEITAFWHKKGVLIVFPFADGRVRLIADMGPSGGKRQDPTLAEVQAVVDDRGPGKVRVTDPLWMSSFGINERKVGKYRKGRVFLAGDAAHIHSPAGGQGMNTGMQDAFNLAWKLALVQKGEASESLLDSYSIERSAVGEMVLKNAGRFTRVGLVKNPVMRRIRNFLVHHLIASKSVREMISNQVTELAVAYGEGPLTGPSAAGVRGPRAGERMVPVREQTPVGEGPDPRFAVLGRGEEFGDLLKMYPKVLESKLRTPPGDGIWLVRPDGYVAVRAAAGDWKTIATYLETRV